MNWITKRIQQEPVLFQGLLQAIIMLWVSFGLNLNDNQVATIAVASAALLSFITRQNVTPVANPKDSKGNQVALS
jgi:hypothetical protein